MKGGYSYYGLGFDGVRERFIIFINVCSIGVFFFIVVRVSLIRVVVVGVVVIAVFYVIFVIVILGWVVMEWIVVL